MKRKELFLFFLTSIFSLSHLMASEGWHVVVHDKRSKRRFKALDASTTATWGSSPLQKTVKREEPAKQKPKTYKEMFPTPQEAAKKEQTKRLLRKAAQEERRRMEERRRNEQEMLEEISAVIAGIESATRGIRGRSAFTPVRRDLKVPPQSPANFEN